MADSIMLVGVMFISPLILLVATVCFFAGRWLGVVPDGAAAPVMFLLLVCACIAGLGLYTSYDALVTQPAALQTSYLGRPYVGPLALRSYDVAIGGEWEYALPPETIAALRPRCVPHVPNARDDSVAGSAGRACDLYLRDEDRSYTRLWIEGDRLHMVSE